MSVSLQGSRMAVHSNEIWSIQYLRASAAIAVVIFHQANHRFRLGAHGVDLFFVISGFIIVALTEDRPITFKQFILDRIARIAPPYWTATIIIFLLTLFHIHMYAAFISINLLFRSLLFIPTNNGHGNDWPILYLGWTLNFEMFFYFIFAIGLTFSQKIRINYMTVVFFIAILVGVMFTPKGAIASTYTNFKLAEFLAGAWIAVIFGINLNRRSNSMLILWSLMVIAALLIMSIHFPKLIYGALSILLLSAGLLVERLNWLPKVRILKLIGDASFAIYLFQEFAFESVNALCSWIDQSTGLHLNGHAPGRLFNVFAALGLGLVVFNFIEKPLTRSVRQFLRRMTGAPIRISAAT